MADKAPRVVAELGRPETADETADRKAENSRIHRQSQTTRNLVGAVVASLGIVAFLILVVVRPAASPSPGIDYADIARQAKADSSQQLIVPALPPEWTANAAELRSSAAASTWYIGFITPTTQFIALEQGLGAETSWAPTVVNGAAETGSTMIAGLTWSVYDQRKASDAGNFAYSMVTTSGADTIVLHGTAPEDDFALLAASIAAESPAGKASGS